MHDGNPLGAAPAAPGPVYVISDAPLPRVQPAARRTWRARWHGFCAVLALLMTAADALISALFGVPPAGWCARQVTPAIRTAYLTGAAGYRLAAADELAELADELAADPLRGA